MPSAILELCHRLIPNKQVINLTTCVMDLKIEKERRHYDSYIMTESLGGNKQSRLPRLQKN